MNLSLLAFSVSVLFLLVWLSIPLYFCNTFWFDHNQKAIITVWSLNYKQLFVADLKTGLVLPWRHKQFSCCDVACLARRLPEGCAITQRASHATVFTCSYCSYKQTKSCLMSNLLRRKIKLFFQENALKFWNTVSKLTVWSDSYISLPKPAQLTTDELEAWVRALDLCLFLR